MQLTHLAIRHFRNIESFDWRPSAGVNLIWGDNGHGKTNVLEALHMVLSGRSFRTGDDAQCRPRRARDAVGESPLPPTRVDAHIVRRSSPRRLRMVLGDGVNGKRLYCDGGLLARLGDLWGEAGVVAFTPDDAGLFRGPPAARRRFLDAILCQTSPAYLTHLQRYQRALRQLNATLKRPGLDDEVCRQAAAYYPELARSGALVAHERLRRLADAQPELARRFTALGGQGRLTARWTPGWRAPEGDAAELAQCFAERLDATFAENRRVGFCRIGPHRDDLSVALDDHPLAAGGSQGQHRLAALTLKLEAARWIEQALDEAPLLLLDDFGSELDRTRREAVLASLADAMQILVTATHPEDLGPAAHIAQSVHIEHGTFRIGRTT